MAENVSKEEVIRTLKSMSSEERQEIAGVIERLEKVPTPVDPKSLIRAISEVYPCIGKTDNRIALHHILLDVKDGCLNLVAADGFKMGASSLPVELPEGQWLIHNEDIKKVKNILRRAQELRAIAGRRSLAFLAKTETGEEEILVTFKALSFPDWRNVFARYISSYKTQVTFESTELKAALRTVKSDRIGPTKLYIEDESIKLSNLDPETGKEKETVIKAQIIGEPNKQAFQWKHLMEVADTFRGAVTLNTNGGDEAALVKKDDTKWLVMPMFVDL